MSNIITKNIIMDGPKMAIVSLYLESDGVEGELKNYVVLDPAVDFNPSIPNTQMSIRQIWYGFSWFDALLSFDDINPFPGWMIPRDAEGYFDFRYFGGIKDRAGIDHTGKLFLSTSGFAPFGSIGTLIVEVKKD